MRKTTKEKKITDFVLRQIPTIRAHCLRSHFNNVGAVIAYLIKYGDGKNIDLTNALKYCESENLNDIIFEYGLNVHNSFNVSWNDIKDKQNDLYFNEFCFANNIDANYIKGV